MLTETNYDDGTLVITRVYPAGQQAVFDAWVEAEQVKDWWGCADTTNVESEVCQEVGGKYEHKMTLRGQYQHMAQGVPSQRMTRPTCLPTPSTARRKRETQACMFG